MNAADLLATQRVVPVVVIEDADDAVPLAKILLASGLDAGIRPERHLDGIETARQQCLRQRHRIVRFLDDDHRYDTLRR